MTYCIGDRVKIVFRPEVGERSSPRWQPQMDANLGLTGKVIDTRVDRVWVQTPNHSTWWYHIDWIERVFVLPGHDINNIHLSQELPP